DTVTKIIMLTTRSLGRAMPSDRDRVGYAFDIAYIKHKAIVWEMQEGIVITNIYKGLLLPGKPGMPGSYVTAAHKKWVRFREWTVYFHGVSFFRNGFV